MCRDGSRARAIRSAARISAFRRTRSAGWDSAGRAAVPAADAGQGAVGGEGRDQPGALPQLLAAGVGVGTRHGDRLFIRRAAEIVPAPETTVRREIEDAVCRHRSTLRRGFAAAWGWSPPSMFAVWF